MKLKALLLSALFLTPPALAGGPVFADHKRVFREEYCYKNVERYIPGEYTDSGRYVRGRVKVTRKRVPCRRLRHPRSDHHHHYHHHSSNKVDDNSCIEGGVLGGIAGAGLGAALSRGDGRLWAIPLGIVGGSMVGCQVDGG